MRTLEQLSKVVQGFQPVSELERACEEIFETSEATDEEKRLAKGPYGRLFKLAREELRPLIVWMKAAYPDHNGRIIDGNQHYDAEITAPDGEDSDPLRVEITLAIDGEQNFLALMYLSLKGIASTFARYAKSGKGKEKCVTEIRSPELKSVAEIIEEQVKLVDQAASRKCSKPYEDNTVIIIYLNQFVGYSQDTISSLVDKCEIAINSKNWTVKRVDLVLNGNGNVHSFDTSK